jgi:hypothetical protein
MRRRKAPISDQVNMKKIKMNKGPLKWHRINGLWNKSSFANAGGGVVYITEMHNSLGEGDYFGKVFIPNSVLMFREYEERIEADEEEGEEEKIAEVTEYGIFESGEDSRKALMGGWKKA